MKGTEIKDLAGRKEITDCKLLPAHEIVFYRIYLDEKRLNGLVARASRNKGGKAKAGPLTVIIESRTAIKGRD